MVVATAATATAIGVMFTLTLRQHTSFKELIALLLLTPTLTIAQIVEVAAGIEIRGAQADFQAVRPAPVVGRLFEWERRKEGKANMRVNLTSSRGGGGRGGGVSGFRTQKGAKCPHLSPCFLLPSLVSFSITPT